jgi:hypothetical protein
MEEAHHTSSSLSQSILNLLSLFRILYSIPVVGIVVFQFLTCEDHLIGHGFIGLLGTFAFQSPMDYILTILASLDIMLVVRIKLSRRQKAFSQH